MRDIVPGPMRAVVRSDNANGVGPSDGLIFSLRTMDQTQSIFTRKGYDDGTGVGSPNGLAFVNSLGN